MISDTAATTLNGENMTIKMETDTMYGLKLYTIQTVYSAPFRNGNMVVIDRSVVFLDKWSF